MGLRSTLINTLLLAAALHVAIVLIPDVPLGIPGEWEWSRHEFAASLTDTLVRFAPAAVGLTVLISVARVGDRRQYRHRQQCVGDWPQQRRGPSRTKTVILLLALVGASWIWLKTTQRCTPAPHRNLKSLWVLYDPSASGYFDEAVFEMDSVGEFLSSYPARMEEGEIYHVGTHPPGLFLLSRLAVDVCRAAPGQTEILMVLVPRPDLQAFRSLEASAHLHRPLSEPEVTALILLSELTTLAAALVVIPLYYLVRRCFSALTAWRTVCLWPTIPCLVVFLPKSDVLFTFTSVSAVSLGVIALASTDSLFRRLVAAVCSGLVLWCGLMLSLAHLPVVVLLMAVCGMRLFRAWQPESPGIANPGTSLRQCTVVLMTIVGTIAVATVVFSLTTACDMFSVWRLNLANHAAFYEQHSRTAWKWLLVNPLELGLAIGLPLAVGALLGLKNSVQNLWKSDRGGFGTLDLDVSIAIAITIGMLWLSCRNSGEAARLWCFMTPWLALLSAQLIRQEVHSAGVKNRATVWHTMLLTQMLVCIITAGRVNGFSV